MNEGCLHEGRVLLPPHADPDALAQLLMGMAAWEEAWTHGDG